MFNMITCGADLLKHEETLYVLKECYLRMDKLKNVKSFQKELNAVETKLLNHLTNKKCESCFQVQIQCGLCKNSNDMFYEFEVEKIRFCHKCDEEYPYSHTKCFNSAAHQVHREELK